MKINFQKYTAAGNDFILINSNKFLDTDKVKFLCNRNFGIGADGIIYVMKKDSFNLKEVFEMQIFNSDGSKADMCGNGLRSCSKFIYHNNLNKDKEFIIDINGFLSEVTMIGEEISCTMPSPKDIRYMEEDSLYFLKVGVNHIVKYVNDLKNIDINREGKLLREKYNANVNFVNNESSFKIRTYERGLESESLACGSGSTAAALVEMKKNNINKINVITKLGYKIKIEKYEDLIKMTGHSSYVFSGTI